MELSFDFCPAAGERLREKERVWSVQAMMSESRVETLNVLAPLCKKLQAITHHTAASQAKKRNRAPLNSPQIKNLLSVFSNETSAAKSSPLSSPVSSSLLPVLCLKQDLERACGIFHLCLTKKRERVKWLSEWIPYDLGSQRTWLVFFRPIYSIVCYGRKISGTTCSGYWVLNQCTVDLGWGRGGVKQPLGSLQSKTLRITASVSCLRTPWIVPV